MFEWSNAYETGIEVIDTQHKKLLEIGAEIETLVNDHAGDDIYDDIIEKIVELEKYTVYHFSTEEELFAKYGYEDSENHIREHKAFIEYLESIDTTKIDENHGKAVNGILKFVSMWVFKHISNTDFRYKEFLIEKMK